jgi:hypothetical protein
VAARESRWSSSAKTAGDLVATFADVKRLAAHLPEVEESTSYRTPALKVRGKSFCRLWGESEHRRDDVHDTEVLVVFCDLAWKESLIESSDGVLFTTSHYDGFGAVLVRLADVGDEDLTAYLEEGYRTRAPATLRRALDA